MSEFLAQVLMVGDGNVRGIGDEAGRGGFSGRIRTHYEDYARHAKQTGAACTDVLSTVHGERTMHMVAYARHIGRIAELASMSPIAESQSLRRLGVLSVGYIYEGLLKRKGPQDCSWRWGDALSLLRDNCRDAGITPILLESPLPVEGAIYADGEVPFAEFLGELNEKTQAHVEGWADYVACDELFGDNKLALMTSPETDGVHMNAAGHEVVTTELIHRINENLGIEGFDYPQEG